MESKKPETGLNIYNIIGICIGVLFMILGLFFVPHINRAADNWAAAASPALIVGGVILIIISLILKIKKK